MYDMYIKSNCRVVIMQVKALETKKKIIINVPNPLSTSTNKTFLRFDNEYL